jgi:hypothetical protein
MFATMVIVLPSHFEGGEVHLTHSDETKIADVGGPSSAFRTSVLAWYTDVLHEVKPITSGYRFALAYNLVRSSDATAPESAVPHDPSAPALRKSLSAWANGLDQEKNVPKKLAWLLEHKYSRMNMCQAALKGPDAHLVLRIRPIAEELGLQLGLAIVSMKIDNNFPSGDDDRWQEGPMLMDGVEVYYNEYNAVRSAKYLVDLDGRLVCSNPKFSRGMLGEMMPEGWGKQLAKLKPDKQEYEGYQGNGAGSVIHCEWLRAL